MTGPISRARRQAAPASPAVSFAAPHAALLIDFDNVTMGIRSDLTKELKTLLNSDIIRGKVTVQRAYADWRRYPQYIMPLTERSIDMIWATAVGSTKKNATDIRLAIDAIELVFTRPEIGTFIVLSGDSDFSSLVLKLKEYGKYVIGIGIRESASDLLIQNCDEYYSYSELAGLNRWTDTPSVQRDPWELVTEALERMTKQGDVMRSDRLKQVMQQIDSNFDERNVGYNRFSKFVAEAQNRGLVQLTKLDNGQFEVSAAVAAGTAKPVAATPAPRPEREGETADRRGRGRGGRDRSRREPPKDRSRPEPTGAAPEAPRRPSHEPAVAGAPNGLTLSAAFGLLTRALSELPSPARHDVVRARMAALHGREDPLLDPSRFSRLLRQANDAEVAEVKKIGEEEYEVALTRSSRARLSQGSPSTPSSPAASESSASTAPATRTSGEMSAPAESAPAVASSATLRFRRGSRGPARPPEISMVGFVDIAPEPPAAAPAIEAPPTVEKAARKTGRGPRKPPAEKKVAAVEAPVASAVAVVESEEAQPASKPRTAAGRRGRGRSRGPRKPA